MAFPQRDDRVERIHRAGGRGAQRRHDGADAAGRQPPREGGDIHPPRAVAGNRLERQTEHTRDSLMRVVRLRRGEDRPARMELPGDPQRLEIRHRAAAAQMAEVRVPADHARERRDGFLLHRGAGAAAVERVVVRVDLERHLVGAARDFVWRLEHLPRIQRIAVRIVVLEAFRDLLQHLFNGLQMPSGRCGPMRLGCSRAASKDPGRTRAS